MRIIRWALILTLVVCAFASAQEQVGSILGTVTTKDGAVIVDAKITAKSPVAIRPFITKSNERGRFVFPALPVGTYTVTFQAEGYDTVEQREVRLTIGFRLRLNQVMSVTEFGETITVSGEAALVDTKSTDTGMSITKELFDKLPKGRDFESIIAVAPGASDESDRFGGIMIDGASSSENVWVIDGAGTNDIEGGRSAQSAVFEFVEEVQVRSGGYDAEFGGAMGGVVNVVTRSGSNEFHGQGSFFFEGDALEGDLRPSLRLNPYSTTPIAEYVQNEEDEWTRYDVGGALGGYLLKDKLWFFAAYMPYFKSVDRTVNFKGSSDNDIVNTETFGYDRTRHYASGKVTVQILENLVGNFSGTIDYESGGAGEYDDTEDILPDRDGTGASVYPDNLEYVYPGYSVSGSLDWYISDNMYANVKGAYHRSEMEINGQEGLTEPRYFVNSSLEMYNHLLPAEWQQTGYWYNYGFGSWEAAIFTDDIKQQASGSTDLTWYLDMGGNHMLKIGGQGAWMAHDNHQGSMNQYWRFYPDQTWTDPVSGTSGRGTYGYIRAMNYDNYYGTIQEPRSYRWALYAQDSWSPTDQLTINYGLRAEKEYLPAPNAAAEEALEGQVFEWGFEDKLAPRIGISYDLRGDGSIKLFANYGFYYDVMKTHLAHSFGAEYWTSGYYEWNDLNYWTYPDVMGADSGLVPIGGPVNWRIPALDTLDKDIEPTMVIEYMAGAEWQFAKDWAISLRFVFKDLQNAIEDVGVIDAEAGGEVYWIGNPGEGAIAEEFAKQGYPGSKAIREYTALDARLQKRFSDNWTGGVSLTISRLWGNYSGLTSTDEEDRDDPNTNRFFDLWWASLEEDFSDATGPLQSDRRYAASIYGSYIFDEGMFDGLVIGVKQAILDGTPFSTVVDLGGMDGYFPFGRADGGRHDMYTQTDLYLEYTLPLGEQSLQFSMNIDNLFDQDGELRRWNYLNYDAEALSDETIQNTYNSGGSLNLMNYFNSGEWVTDPRYGMTRQYQGARSIRLAVKYVF